MKKFITLVLAGMMLMGAYSVISGNSYAMTNWDFFGLGNIFRTNSIEGHWTMVGYYDYGQYVRSDIPGEYGANSPEITFNNDGTFSLYLPDDYTGLYDGYWSDEGDGYFSIYGPLLGTEAMVEDGTLYIGGTSGSETLVFAR